MHDGDLSLINASKPTPCCGHSGQARQIWPSVPAQRFLGIVTERNLEDDDEKRVATILLCTSLELLLENAIWEVLVACNTPTEVAEFILETNQGREKRKKVFNNFSATSLGELLESNGLGNFMKRWKDLSEKRNGIVHGQYYVALPTATFITDLLADSLRAFSIVENDIVAQNTS
ncbi:MAG: hypothetical protein ABIG09_07975 [bacterium]